MYPILALNGVCGAAINDIRGVTVNIQKQVDCLDEEVHLDFALNGESICGWWWPHRKTGDYTKEPCDFFIWDLNGRLIGGSSNSNRLALLREFPRIAWRERYAQFLEGSVAWGFASDLRSGFRIVQKTEGYSMLMFDAGDPTKTVWTHLFPQTGVPPRSMALLQDYKKGPVLIATDPASVQVMDGQTGTIKRTINLAMGASGVNQRKRNESPALQNNNVPSTRFSSFVSDYEQTRGLLACGSFFDTRVRVFSLSAPDRILFEANSTQNSREPKGGTWRVVRVEFLSQGKYLLTECFFGGSETDIILRPTEVFDTRTWKRVWKKDGKEARSVALSPNGSKIAFLQGNVLEIHPFQAEESK